MEQFAERNARRVPAERIALPHTARVPQHRERGRRDLLARLGEHPLHPAADLALWGWLLAHLVRDIARQPLGAVLKKRGDQRVFRPEVPVEGVVRQARRGHDVGDPRPGRRAALAHQLQGGVEQAPHLARVVRASLGQGALRDPRRNIALTVQNCVIH
jgi:hypothetical protein